MFVVTDETRVSIPFTATDGVYELNDAIVLTKEQFDSITDEELQALKESRFNNYKTSVIEASNKEPVEPTAEELQAELAQVIASKEAIELREQEIISQLDLNK